MPLFGLKHKYGDHKVRAVWGFPSEKIVCSLWGVFCILQQWVRIILLVSINLLDKAWRKLTCSPRKKYVAKKGSLAAGKQVLFIRHGQGMHNVSMLGWYLVDPPLTKKGEGQAKELHENIKDQIKDVELVIVSPLMRAMQTALGGFEGCTVPFHVTPLLRERLGAPCDEGRPKSELVKLIPEMADWGGFKEMPEEWWTMKCLEYDFNSRIDELLEFIASRPEKTIAVVGHGGIFTRILGVHLKNCGFHWVDFKTPASDEAATGTEMV